MGWLDALLGKDTGRFGGLRPDKQRFVAAAVAIEAQVCLFSMREVVIPIIRAFPASATPSTGELLGQETAAALLACCPARDTEIWGSRLPNVVVFAREIAHHSRPTTPPSQVVRRYSQDSEVSRVQLLIRWAEILAIADVYWIARLNTDDHWMRWNSTVSTLADRVHASLATGHADDPVPFARQLLLGLEPKRRAVDAALSAGA
jgi:hypothetical protein